MTKSTDNESFIKMLQDYTKPVKRTIEKPVTVNGVNSNKNLFHLWIISDAEITENEFSQIGMEYQQEIIEDRETAEVFRKNM